MNEPVRIIDLLAQQGRHIYEKYYKLIVNRHAHRRIIYILPGIIDYLVLPVGPIRVKTVVVVVV